MATATADLPPAATELKDKGNRCFGEKDYQAAIAHYESALAIAPGNPVLLSNIAASHLALGQWTEALARADECLAADPAFLKAYGRKAAAQLGLIRPGDAERTLLAGLQRDPANDFLKNELDKLRREDDGDQSPRRSRDGSDRQLRDMQARVGVALSPFAAWPSPTFQAAFMGDETVFQRHFKPADLKLRALEGRLPLVVVVVAGAQRIRRHDSGPPGGRSASDVDRGTQHARVLRRLLDAGARVDARDAAGWTALHHATAHHPVLHLAEMLLEAGADVNAQDRFGTYALVNCVMTGEVPSVRLLLKYGAKPDLKDNDGCDALGVSGFNPEIQSLLYKAHTANKRPGDERLCANCGKVGAKKTCAGCGGGVYYCGRGPAAARPPSPHPHIHTGQFSFSTQLESRPGRECQTAHWPTHKAQCRKSAPSASAAAAAAAASGSGGSGAAGASSALPRELRVGVEVENRPLINFGANMGSTMEQIAGGTGGAKNGRRGPAVLGRGLDAAATSFARAAGGATRQAPIKVKIQVPAAVSEAQRRMLVLAGELPDAMLCYNQDRSLVCRMGGASGPGRQLAELIRREGIMGAKGYFAAYFDDRCPRQGGIPREMVVMTAMLPAQPF